MCHTFIRSDAGFQPSQSGNQIVLSCVANQKERMFLGHGNDLEEWWDFASRPVRFMEFSSLEFMVIFKVVSFEVKRLPLQCFYTGLTRNCLSLKQCRQDCDFLLGCSAGLSV